MEKSNQLKKYKNNPIRNLYFYQEPQKKSHPTDILNTSHNKSLLNNSSFNNKTNDFKLILKSCHTPNKFSKKNKINNMKRYISNYKTVLPSQDNKFENKQTNIGKNNNSKSNHNNMQNFSKMIDIINSNKSRTVKDINSIYEDTNNNMNLYTHDFLNKSSIIKKKNIKWKEKLVKFYFKYLFKFSS